MESKVSVEGANEDDVNVEIWMERMRKGEGKPAVFSVYDEVVAWVDRLIRWIESIRDSSVGRNTDGIELAKSFKQRIPDLIVKRRVVELKEATDVAGRAVNEHTSVISLGGLSLGLCFDALESV